MYEYSYFPNYIAKYIWKTAIIYVYEILQWNIIKEKKLKGKIQRSEKNNLCFLTS